MTDKNKQELETEELEGVFAVRWAIIGGTLLKPLLQLQV
jgi:hypothetical protein